MITEEDRLKALQELEILDTPDEVEYDQLVHLASQVCGTPISLVSLVDQNRQWFKAAVGLEGRETHRDVSFCAHAIRQPNLFVVEDALEDIRFRENALVTDAPHIRFYAGFPIQSPNGSPLGTLCVIDTVPRALSEGQRTALKILGLQVQARLELRYRKSLLEKALEENNRLNKVLQERNDLFNAFMDNGPFVSYIKNKRGEFLFFKSHHVEKFSIPNKQFSGLTGYDIFPLEIADEIRRNDLAVFAAGEPMLFREISLDAHGSQLHWKSYKFPIRDADGALLLAGISIEVTEEVAREKELAQATAQLELMATTDGLTGLFNRRVFQNRLETEFAIYQRKERPLTLMIIDLDDFKKRNDNFGHAAGDAALMFVGEILRTITRKGDLSVRLGGEEFAVLMPDTGVDAAMLVAGRIQEAMRERPGAPSNLTASIGIASAADTSGNSWEELFSQADQAMYEAKNAGKNRVVLYQPVSS